MKSPADQQMLMNNPLENENQLLGMVEGFFDFSNKEEEEEDGVVEDVAAPEAEAEAGKSVDSTTPTTRVSSAVDFSSNSSGSGSAAGNGDLCHSDELLFLLDELPDTTDWIANIVDESYSSEDIENFQLISGVKSSSSSLTTANTTNSDVSEKPITAKARSKRPRMAPLNWASRIVQRPPTTTEASIVTSSELSSVIPTPVMKSAKVAKKETTTTTTTTAGPLGPLGPDGRRCLHCDAQNTPQWRTGPLGPKTLCNACGVRYKSGRLVPEYRPAASPTFITSKHSNSHRKVLELRRQNGIVQQHEQQSTSSTANPQLFLPRHPHPHPTNAPNASAAPGGGGGGELWQQMI